MDVKLWKPQVGLNWFTPENWEPMGVPGPHDDITVNGLVEVTAGIPAELDFKLKIGATGTLLLKAPKEHYNIGGENLYNTKPDQYDRLPRIINEGTLLAMNNAYSVRCFIVLENHGVINLSSGGLAFIVPVRNSEPRSLSTGAVLGAVSSSLSFSGSFDFSPTSSLVADAVGFNGWGDNVGDSILSGSVISQQITVYRRRVSILGHMFSVGRILLRDDDARLYFRVQKATGGCENC